MDWLQFMASVLGSLAWPAVVVYFLFLIRSNLSPLLTRLQDLTLPGGAKATFTKTVEAAKDSAIVIATNTEEPKQLETTSLRIDGSTSNKEKMRVYFEQTERAMMERMEELPLSERLPPADFIFHILRPHRNSEALYNLYNQLRNILLNASNLPDSQIKDSDLFEYINLCKFVLSRFRDDYDDWSNYKKSFDKLDPKEYT